MHPDGYNHIAFARKLESELTTARLQVEELKGALGHVAFGVHKWRDECPCEKCQNLRVLLAKLK
jgi:hypothetical protein